LPKKKRQPAHEKTTEEVLRDVFHPRMADALEEAVSEANEPVPDKPEPRRRSTKSDSR
jgi:hypothetical protein